MASSRHRTDKFLVFSVAVRREIVGALAYKSTAQASLRGHRTHIYEDICLSSLTFMGSPPLTTVSQSMNSVVFPH